MRTILIGLFLLPSLSLLAAEPAQAPVTLSATPLALPGGPGPVSMDYLAYDPATSRVWVPAGNTGRVDVIDTKTDKLTPIENLPTRKEVGKRGERTVGPSSATVGGGTAYVGNRADMQVCAIDGKTLKRGGCVTLPSMPDGLAYVATTQEVWVTTPRDKSLTILSVKRPEAPVVAGKIALEGEPEGYAVDAARGLFYTNLEDKDATLVIDVRTRKVTATWKPGCGEAGPRGLAVDGKRHQLIVACTDKAVVLATDKNGAVRGQIETGGGVDNIDYEEGRHLLYVASGKTSTLTVARVAEDGTLTKAATAPTAEGVRVVVVDSTGKAYAADSKGGRLLVIPALK